VNRPLRAPRGQSVTELSLGLLVLVPALLTGIFLAESSIFRLDATEAATEPLWDATAFSQQQYEGGAFVLTPGAISTAVSRANGRMRARMMVFATASAPVVSCGGAPDMGYTVGGSPLQENGGIACNSQLVVGDRFLPRFFLDQGPGGFFKESLGNLRRAFVFRENEKDTTLKMAIGDWGLTKQGNEPEECPLTMDSCTNNGFFGKARATYFLNNTSGGVRGRDNVYLVQGMIDRVPIPVDYPRVTDFQMSYRGESGFEERVPVIEGDREWFTTPFLYARADAYNARNNQFLGSR